jgi:catechol 2,3-dioxygenase-like lactoylglutathione lyase family enzyme
MEIDHVAVLSRDIAASVKWYVEKFGAVVLYQDAAWAFMRLGQGKLALVTPGQHPPHVAIRIEEEALGKAALAAGNPVDRHRDGTKGIYITDLDGNQIELICYPLGETVYK